MPADRTGARVSCAWWAGSAPRRATPSAAADLTAIAARLQAAYPDTNAGASRVAVVPLQEAVVGAHRPLLLVLQGAVALVLLMVCANLAGLILARAASRQEELAIRSALGATRGRLILQLGAESLLLGLLGGLAGILLAYWLVPVLLALGPADLPRSSQVRLDGAAVAFGFGLAVVAGLLSGIVPALQATGAVRPVGSLTGRTVASSRAHARRAVVLVEVALSLVMLAGAGLLLKSFVRLQRVDPGFRTERLLTLRLSLPAGRYAQREQLTAFYDRLQPRLRALPDVEAVGVSSVAPLTAWRATVNFTTEGAALQRRQRGAARPVPGDRCRLPRGGGHAPPGRTHVRRDGRQRGRPRRARQPHPGPALLPRRRRAGPRRSASTTRACPRGRRRWSVSWGT